MEQVLQCLAVSLQHRLSLQSKSEHTAKHLEECQRVLDTLQLQAGGGGGGGGAGGGPTHPHPAPSVSGVSPSRPLSPSRLDATLLSSAAASQVEGSSGGVAVPQRGGGGSHDIAGPRVLPGSPPNHRPLCHGDAVRNLAAACRAPAARVVGFLESAVLSGSTVATAELGFLLVQGGVSGNGSVQSKRKGLELLDEAVTAGLPSAMHHVAWCLLDGIGVEEDVSQGVHWLFQAAAMDYGPAMHDLGQLCEDGVAGKKSGSMERDLPSAFRWYKKAALLGFGPSQLNLAKLYLLSDNVLQRQEEALASASPLPPPGDDIRLKAMYWLRCAADEGSAEARQLLERTGVR